MIRGRKITESPALTRWVCAGLLGVGALMAHAGQQTAPMPELPSGQSVTLQEVLVEDVNGTLTARFRFISPQIAESEGGVTFADVEADLEVLCSAFALSYLKVQEVEAQSIVISLTDRATEFGIYDPTVTQYIDLFRPEGGVCVWEGL